VETSSIKPTDIKQRWVTAQCVTNVLCQPVIDGQFTGLGIDERCSFEKHAAKTYTFSLIFKGKTDGLRATKPFEK